MIIGIPHIVDKINFFCYLW